MAAPKSTTSCAPALGAQPLACAPTFVIGGQGPLRCDNLPSPEVGACNTTDMCNTHTYLPPPPFDPGKASRELVMALAAQASEPCLTDATCGCFDLAIDPVTLDLVTTDAVQSHVLVALAARARVEDAVEFCHPDTNCGDVGGWWFDAFRTRPIGSTLWSLEGRTADNDARLATEQAITDALQPLINDNLIGRIELSTSIDSCTGVICVDTLDVYPPDGSTSQRIDLECLWPSRTA